MSAVWRHFAGAVGGAITPSVAKGRNDDERDSDAVGTGAAASGCSTAGGGGGAAGGGQGQAGQGATGNLSRSAAAGAEPPFGGVGCPGIRRTLS